MLKSMLTLFLAASLPFSQAAPIEDDAANFTVSAVTDPAVEFRLYTGSTCGSGTTFFRRDGVCFGLSGSGSLEIIDFYGSCHDSMFETPIPLNESCNSQDQHIQYSNACKQYEFSVAPHVLEATPISEFWIDAGA